MKHERKCEAKLKKTCPSSTSAKKLKALIRAKGGKPAFPCNVSINEVAAHYTSPPGDTHGFLKAPRLRWTLGVHVDGYVTDTAFTV